MSLNFGSESEVSFVGVEDGLELEKKLDLEKELDISILVSLELLLHAIIRWVPI